MWFHLSWWKKRLPSAISAGGSSMWSVEAGHQWALLCALPVMLGTINNFREAVIRLYTPGCMRGKSGHHRAGFPVKTGGACFKASSRPVPQKTNRSPWGVRVKRWGKSPPPVEQSNGHGKPNPMQDEIGNRAARLWFRVRRTTLRRDLILRSDR